MNMMRVPAWSGQRIVIIGDLIVDYYVKGKANRLCPEAPVPIVNVEKTVLLPGGAANLARNIQSLGGIPVLIGIVGDDSYGEALLKSLRELEIEVIAIIDSERPTTVKTRVVVQNHLVARFDLEHTEIHSPLVQDKLRSAIETKIIGADTVVISDYAKGVVSESVCKRVLRICRESQITTLIDPKGTDYKKYRGATAITPNIREAEMATGISITDELSLCRAGEILLETTRSEAVLITRAEKGVSIFHRNGMIDQIPAKEGEICDVTGAGDTFIATLTLSLANGYSIWEAGFLANLAAGIVIKKPGTAVVTMNELHQAMDLSSIKSHGSF